MFSQPTIVVQKAAWMELSWVLENCSVMQYGANQREDFSALKRQGKAHTVECSILILLR